MLRKWLTLGVLVALTVVLGWLAWSRWGTLGAPRAELAGRYGTEEQWMAGEIVQDLVEMAAAAGGRKDASSIDVSIQARPSPAGVIVSLALDRAGPARHELVWRDHVWAPETYLELARAALSSVARSPASSPPSESEAALEALLTPLPSVIESENQRVSDRLARSIADPDAHEEAALVIGALGMREAAGAFGDVRQLLCRMAAHLSFARALREGPAEGLSGRYAAAVLARLAGRTADAMKRVESLEAAAAGSKTQLAWLRSLRLSITEDWRSSREVPGESLLERIQTYRAIRRTLGDAVAIESLAEDQAGDASDWGRIALDGNFGLAVGEFAGQGADPEVEEARDLFERVHGRGLKDGEVVQALNKPAERCLTPEGPRVIGWGTWAASIQRHLCHRVVANDRFVRQTLGQRREGRARMKAFDSRWSGLVLYPFVEAGRWKNGMLELEAFRDGIRTGVRTAAKTPEIVSAMSWANMSEVTDVAVTRRRMPDSFSWFAVPVPEGTAYRAALRMIALGVRAENPALLETLLRLDPWSFDLGYRTLTTRHPRRVPLDELRRTFGSREEYDLRVLSWLTNDADPGSPERIPLFERMCEIQSDRCLALANQYVAERRDEEAVRSFRRAFMSAKDPLLLANNSRFLVRFLYEKGEPEEAVEVATAAAGTYSGRGLETMALLEEWRGRPEEAEKYHRQVESQYEDRSGLLGFFYRMKQKDPSYEPKFAALLAEFFPNGLEKLDRGALPALPTDGVRISMLDAQARSFGLDDSDVIVAVDGWRVRSEPQYRAALDLDWRPELALYRWRNGAYADVSVRAPGRALAYEVDTYPRAERHGHVHAR